MKTAKYIKFFTLVAGTIVALNFTAKISRAEEANTAALREYLAQMVPTEEDHKKCKSDKDCTTIVNDILKLSPDLWHAFVVNPDSESFTQAIPPELAARLSNPRVGLRNVDGTANISNTPANNTVTVGEDGRPTFGGASPQKIVWGQLLNQGVDNTPRRDLSYIGEGEEPGQSGTSVNPSNSGAPSTPPTPQGPSDAQAQQAEARLLDALDDQLAVKAGDDPEGFRIRRNQEFEVYRAAAARKANESNYSKTFWDKINPFNQPDPNNFVPVLTEAEKVESQKAYIRHLGGRGTGATDPAFRSIDDQEGPSSNRRLSKEQTQAEYDKRTSNQNAGAGIGVEAPTLGSGPRPGAPVADCGQPGSPVGCEP